MYRLLLCLINFQENLHFDNEEDSHMSSENFWEKWLLPQWCLFLITNLAMYVPLKYRFPIKKSEHIIKAHTPPLFCVLILMSISSVFWDGAFYNFEYVTQWQPPWLIVGITLEQLQAIPIGRRRKFHDDVTIIVIDLGSDYHTAKASTFSWQDFIFIFKNIIFFLVHLH